MEEAVVRQHVREPAVKVGRPQEEAGRLQELHGVISRRAYELFEARGYEHGHDLEDWFRAEAELLHPVRPKIHHTVNTITVRAELPGFRADQIQVIVEPRRVTLGAGSGTTIEHPYAIDRHAGDLLTYTRANLRGAAILR